MKELKYYGIETREGFVPANMQKIFLDMNITKLDSCPNANKIAFNSFYLPSGPKISKIEQDYVIDKLTIIIENFIK